MATARKPFHVRVLETIVRTRPTNEHLLASDLRVTVPSVKRVVDTLVRQGLVERYTIEGYPPELALTRDGIEYLREREPGWWKRRANDASRASHRDPKAKSGRLGSAFQFVPRRPFVAGSYRFNPGRGRKWFAYRGGDFIGEIVETSRGYRTSGYEDIDDALNSFISHKLQHTYAELR